MAVLVLGATGMLGHKLMQVLSRRTEVVGTVRGSASALAAHPVVGGFTLLGGVAAEDFDSVVRAVATVRPAAVVNGIGVIKQLPSAKDPLPSIGINALFPHRLAQLCRAAGARLVHLGTDCVFSGRKGAYTEDDPSDAEDLYGRTKHLGEVTGEGCLTLRTSIIGRELGRRSGLLEWFLAQRGKRASGYAHAIYSGLTTHALAGVIADVLERHPRLSGLWHVASDPISKFDLLQLVNREFALGVTLERDETFRCDRSLDGSRFREATGFRAPAWPDLVAQLAADPTPYDALGED